MCHIAWQGPMHVGHIASHMCDTWHAMCHNAWPFWNLYIGGFQFSSWQLKLSAWGEQQGEGGGRERRKGGEEKRKGGKERRK